MSGFSIRYPIKYVNHPWKADVVKLAKEANILYYNSILTVTHGEWIQEGSAVLDSKDTTSSSLSSLEANRKRIEALNDTLDDILRDIITHRITSVHIERVCSTLADLAEKLHWTRSDVLATLGLRLKVGLNRDMYSVAQIKAIDPRVSEAFGLNDALDED